MDRLKKSHPHIYEDLQEALIDIQKDFRHAKHATSIPGFNDTLFKYRQKSSDARKGTRSAFRIIAYYHKESHTIYPIVVYSKAVMEDYDRNELKRIVKDLAEVI